MELLRDMENRGYPRDYLLSRIRVRRSCLIVDWGAALASAEPLAAVDLTPGRQVSVPDSEEAVWTSLQREFAWVYSQMEQRTRTIFVPLFLYLELRTIILCLRRRSAGDEGDMAELFRFSLLSARVRGILQGNNDIPAIVAGLDKLFGLMAETGTGLTKAYREGGLAAFEERLSNFYLEQTAHTRLHPVLAEFFSSLIDVKNLIILAKDRRWRIAAPPSFIGGGKLRASHLLDAARAPEMTGASCLLRRVTGTEVDPTAGNVESILLAAISRMARRAGRETDGIGLILDYLWRCSMQARNLSLLVHGPEIDRELLGEELVT
jgi:vacuolar-type H+-ATPase subunit C/Vma6